MGARREGAAGMAVLGLLFGLGCSGTDHAVFLLETVQKPVKPPATTASDAGRPVTPDAGRPARIKTGDEDAGGPDPGLDPTVVFAWKESLPGQGTCKTGRYTGSFSCTVHGPGIAPPPPTISGATTFVLSGSAEEQTLSIVEGSLSGPLFGAGVTGKLDCLTKHFVGTTQNGTALIGSNMQYALTLFPTFDATLDGSFDDQSLVITGTFRMVNMEKQSCDGTFRVSVAP